LRLWEQTEEQVFLDEERENELDALFESSLEKESGVEKNEKESDLAGKKTLETIKSGEQLIEAIELCIAERATWSQYNEVSQRFI